MVFFFLFRKLFVGGLSWETTEGIEIITLFSVCNLQFESLNNIKLEIIKCIPYR